MKTTNLLKALAITLTLATLPGVTFAATAPAAARERVTHMNVTTQTMEAPLRFNLITGEPIRG